MITLVALILSATAGSQASATPERSQIQSAAAARHGAGTELTSVLVAGDFAIVRGTAGAGSVHDGLRRSHDAWHVVCPLPSKPVSASTLIRLCGFSQSAAIQLSADDAANTAAAKGEFSSAAAAEHTAAQYAAPETKLAEAQRAQLLNTLNEQMNLGQISRPDAIRKWNEMRFSFYLP